MMKMNYQKTILSMGIVFIMSVNMIGCGSSGDALPKESSVTAGGEAGMLSRAGRSTFMDRLSRMTESGGTGQTSGVGLSAISNEKTEDLLSGIGMEETGEGTGDKSATVMIYMNGSDLESDGGAATEDILEMIESGIGNNVNVVLQTMGTKQWQNDSISPNTAQTFVIKDRDLKLVRDRLGQISCVSEDTLSEFVDYCKTNYPADRNILIFWDHGGGPVYGFGVDEWQDENDSLTLSEISRALKKSGVYFDFIGMDCCIMANLETCYAFAPYCKYTLLSEDFESGLGWSYTDWMKALEENPGISTPLLGKKIIDSIIKDNETSEYGDSSCMGMFNESTASNLFEAWKAYAYKNQDAFFGTNYSRQHKARGRASKAGFENYGSDMYDVTLSDYYITDVLALIESVDNESTEAKNLTSALKAAVTYYGHTSDKNELTGLSVSLPYGDERLYDEILTAYKDINIDNEYLEWLGNFVEAGGDYYGYEDFEEGWGGWSDYEADYGCCDFGNNGSAGFGQYAYNYGSGDFYGHEDSFLSENWIYDYEDDIWYLEDDGVLFLYDDESNMLMYYDEEADEFYYYDEEADGWLYADMKG